MKRTLSVSMRAAVHNLLPESETEDFLPSDEDMNDAPFNIHSEKIPSSSSDELTDNEGVPVAQLFIKSGLKMSACNAGQSKNEPENFVSIFNDDSDSEDNTDDEENEDMELEFLDLSHEDCPPMILGTMYKEEAVANNSLTVNEMDDNLHRGSQEHELNHCDDVIMEETVSDMTDKHTVEPKLGQQPQRKRGMETPRSKGTPRGKETTQGKVTPQDEGTPGGTETPENKGTPEATGTPQGKVTPRSPRDHRTPRVKVTPRSTGSSRGKGRAPRVKRRLLLTEPQWRTGDKLIEAYVTDDDVPEELRQIITHIAKSRETARKQTAKRNRKLQGEDEIEDDCEDEMLFAGGAKAARFEWSSMDDYSGKREEFLPEVTGPARAYANAYEAFREYWDDDIIAHIVKETNRNGEALARLSSNFAGEWYETNVHEILILFAFWMMLGIVRMPTTKSCFTLNPMLQVNIFRHMFSKNRYINLHRAFTLQFNDCTTRADNSDLTQSFGPILDHLNSRFKESYVPSQNICIDESLLLWKGNLSFRQFIKTKAARSGVKTFELCESATGYLWSFFIYLGANTVYDPDFPPTLLKSTATVLKLVKPLLDKGYTLYLDNWFNSPLLAKYLKMRKTDCVGTLRANRRNVPPIIPLCKLSNGHFVARHSGDVVVMAYQDRNRKVTTISTYHGAEQNLLDPKPHRPSQYKPQSILDYNKGIGGVDRKDQMLEPYLLERKRGLRWNLKVFKRLLNCSILNSRVLLKGTAANPKDHLVFRLELVEQILLHHLQKVPKPKPVGAMTRTIGRDTTAEKHWPRQIEEVMNSGRRSRRRCAWCTQNNTNRRTTFVCSECEVPLCVQPCFKEYHNYHSSSASKARSEK